MTNLKEDFRIPKQINQHQTYFHRTFRATITSNKLLESYHRLGQWGKVAKEFNVSSAYIIHARKWLGIFKKTITKGKQYGGLNSHITKNNGKRIENRGYILVGRYHPENTKEKTCYEHTLVMEKYLGRTLLPSEIIHHIDGNKSNNKIENLFLCNHSTHRKADISAIRLIYKLYNLNIVKFDKNSGEYIYNETI